MFQSNSIRKFHKLISCSMFISVVLAILVLFPGKAHSDGKISGYMFGDYYYVINHDNSAFKGLNGFWFRRVYFTYDYEITDEWKTRVRLEFNTPGDFKTKDLTTPYLKDGYVAWKKRDITHSIILGLSPTPAFNFIEEFWQYRSIERTALDLYKMENSRDFGIAFKGAFDKGQKVMYHLMIGNGEGTKSEVNKDKQFMGALQFFPRKEIAAEFYVDYGTGKAHTNFYTMQGFFGFKTEKGRLGFQYSYQKKQQGVGKDDLNVSVYSLFASVKPSQKTAIIGRVDRMNKPLAAGPSITYIPFSAAAPFYALFAGFDFSPTKNVKIMPNIIAAFYDKYNGIQPTKDTYFHLTCFYSF